MIGIKESAILMTLLATLNVKCQEEIISTKNKPISIDQKLNLPDQKVSKPIPVEPKIVLSYDLIKKNIATQRKKFSQEYKVGNNNEKREIIEKSKKYLANQIMDNLIFSWYGVPWKIIGGRWEEESKKMYQERAGKIKEGQKSEDPFQENTYTNCSLYVSTVLKHAGFRVERYRLAQQLSANIIRSLAPKKQIKRPRGGQTIEDFVADMKTDRRGPGVYIIGLDMHVGFLINGSVKSPAGNQLPEDIYFCHADYGHNPQAVRCEKAIESPVLANSNCRVNGNILNNDSIYKWLTGKRIKTVGNH